MLLNVAVALMFITSCGEKKCEDPDANGYVNAEEETWLSYTPGEMLIFRRDIILVDTFWVGNRISEASPKQQIGDPCIYSQETLKCPISNRHGRDFELSVSHQNKYYVGSAGIVYDQQHMLKFSDYSPQNNIIIHGNTYNSVYIMTRDTTSFQSPDVWRFYYTKQNGILRFDITQGQQWERIN